MSSMPFFTVIIPTRNRPDFIIECVQSALLQNFKDIEVIVSDNSTDKNTKTLLEKEDLLTQVKYVNPSEDLSMPDHWEFASRFASGRFVLFVTDRSVLKQNTLQTIHDAYVRFSKTNAVEVISWKWDLFDDELKMLMPENRFKAAKGEYILSTESLIADFLKPKDVYHYSRPRALNSCYSREYGESIRKRFGHIFTPIAPDDHFAFTVITTLPSVLFIHKSLFISRGLNASAGGAANYTPPIGYFNTLGERGFIKHCPTTIPSIIVSNYEDYFRCVLASGKKIQMRNQDWVEYYVKYHWEILLQETFTDIKHTELISSSRQQWRDALAKESTEVRNSVQQRIKTNHIQKYKKILQGITKVKKTVRFARYLKALVSQHVYSSALKAADF